MGEGGEAAGGEEIGPTCMHVVGERGCGSSWQVEHGSSSRLAGSGGVHLLYLKTRRWSCSHVVAKKCHVDKRTVLSAMLTNAWC